MIGAMVFLRQTPPSLNRIGTRGSWRQTHVAKRIWEHELGMLLMEARFPRGLARVHARAELRFPTRRRRDSGNFSWLIEKALGDALVAGGWLPDDTHDRFALINVTIDPDPGESRTLVFLTGMTTAEVTA